jgi:hypothetical protein
MQCLCSLYNRPGCEPLVLDAHVLSAKALEEQEGQGESMMLPLLWFCLFLLSWLHQTMNNEKLSLPWTDKACIYLPSRVVVARI